MRTSENHGLEIGSDFSRSYIEKYAKGQAEHGGKFWRKPTLSYMKEEILDMWAYFHVHQEHIEEIIKIAEASIAESFKDPELLIPSGGNNQVEALIKIRNILKFGNEDGIVEEEKSK